ncbi:MAG: hypothetical protein BroJett014_22690 [Planctomycetota bacterium]|nr:hypothetical protein [Planctomycetota bacterium]GIK53296.1 MAG: hypothetical protein BroJett014_22690 [Planctomycetota bacterium]
MKRVSLMLAFALFATGCTVTKSGQVVQNEETSPLPQPAKVVEADSAERGEHLGDPTFEREVVKDAPREEAAQMPAKAVRDPELERGMQFLAAGDLRKARMALSIAITRALPAAAEAEALDALKQINGKIFLSTGDMGDCEFYEVVAGDTLSTIAQRKGTTVEMIQRLNGLSGTRIAMGQKLKLLKGTFTVTVWKDRFVMDLKLDSAFIRRYRVGLGVDGCTPLGEFVVKNRIPEPADGSYPFGHEKHRLGNRWLGLKSDAGHKGYGIHGCRPEEEGSIGTECSQGCVRMAKADLEEFYDIVPVGTKVVIIERGSGPQVSK